MTRLQNSQYMFWNLHVLQALQGTVKTVIKTMNMFAAGQPKTKSLN